MYLDQRRDWDFNPVMKSERIDVDINVTASVLEVGNTIVETYCVNGRPWTSFVKTFDDVRPLLLFWLQAPVARDYVAELLRYGVTITPTWVNLYTPSLRIKMADGSILVPRDGSRLYAKTPTGIACGFGEVELNGKVIFMPVYGEDTYSPGIQGCSPGEEIHLYLVTDDQPGEIQLYSNPPLLWTANGARIEIPLMQTTPVTLIEKSDGQ